jgi:hypothetical protein
MITIFVSVCGESMIVVKVDESVLLTPTRHDLSHVILPIGVKHLISLIDDGVAAMCEQRLK